MSDTSYSYSYGNDNTKTVVRQLLTLASDPDNQVYMCRESGILNGLLGYLASSDDDIVMMAAQAVDFLASHPSNRTNLMAVPGMAHKLKQLHSHHNVKVRGFSVSIMSSLKRRSAKKPVAADPVVSDENRAANSNTNPSERSPLKPKPSPAPASRVHMITMKAMGIHEETVRCRVETALIQVQGVISVTLDQMRGQAVVCTRTPQHEIMPLLVTAVAEATVGATAAPQQKPSTLPSYLDDDEEEDEDYGGAVASFGAQTLEARLEAKRREEEEKQDKQARVSSLLSRVGEGIGRGLGALFY